jgi:hypothetical protein
LIIKLKRKMTIKIKRILMKNVGSSSKNEEFGDKIKNN